MDKQQAAEYFERHKQTMRGLSAGDYIDRDDFLAFVEAHEARQSPTDAVAFAEIKCRCISKEDFMSCSRDCDYIEQRLARRKEPQAHYAKICPNCGSHDVVMFDSDNDLCNGCGKWFPAVEKVPIYGPSPCPQPAGPVWVKGAPPLGIWFCWYQWDAESLLPSIVTVSENAKGLFYDINGGKVEASDIIKYLDESAPQVLYG